MAALLAVFAALAFLGTAAQAADLSCAVTHTVKKGETLSGVLVSLGIRPSQNNVSNVVVASSLKDPNMILIGQKLCIPQGIKVSVNKPVKVKLVVDAPQCINLGRAPFNWSNSLELRLKGIDLNPDLTSAEKIEAKAKITAGPGKKQLITSDMVFKSMPFQGKDGKVHFLNNVKVCTPEQGGRTEAIETWILSTGTIVGDPLRCGNISVVLIPKRPVPVPELPPVEPVKPEPPVFVEPPKVIEPPKVEPPPVDEIPPFHVTPEEVAGKPRCEAQAGVGAYGNRVYHGKWAYGETICYIWKDGEWQAGPGIFAMYGDGHSMGSAFRNKEYGIGFQVGAQRNWINDKNRLSSFDLKLRFLPWDKSWGSNNDSGYAFTQRGKKIGLYTSYAERTTGESDGPLVGVIGEYWKSFGQKVDSTWSAQPVQDRGSIAAYAFYDTKLSDDGKWRIRYLGGIAHTNWDSQNWLRLSPEFRYNEWLMFGPQLTLPIGISQANLPMTAHDLTTLGAFVRVELGKPVREADAKQREGQLEFIPVGEVAKQPQGQLEFVPATEAAKPPE